MMLTPREQEKLRMYVVADLARKRQGRGLNLNVAEATALICEALLEGARWPDSRRAGGRYSDLLPVVQIEATFPDDTRLISCHDLIL